MIRKKRSDTKVGSVEKKYSIDFGVRSDMKLGKLLIKKGFSSLTKAIKAAESGHPRRAP